MATTARPQITADDLAKFNLKFDSEICSRCDGTGQFAHHGTCFKCSGRKTLLTRAGAAARKRFDDTMAELMHVAIEDIKPGDNIWASFDYRFAMMTPYRTTWREVRAVEADAYVPGRIVLLGIPAKEAKRGVYEAGEMLGEFTGQPGDRVARYDRDALTEVWNRTLKLKGAWLVNRETGEEIGARDWAAEEAARTAAAAKRLDRKQAQLDAKVAVLVEAHPLLAELTYLAPEDEGFLASIGSQLRNRGTLTDKQIAAAERAIIRNMEKQARADAEAAPVAPEGRTPVSGKVEFAKVEENDDLGEIPKVRIRTAEGWTVWVTAPKSLAPEPADVEELVGKRVELVATLKPSAKDPSHAWGSRPTNGRLLC